MKVVVKSDASGYEGKYLTYEALKHLIEGKSKAIEILNSEDSLSKFTLNVGDGYLAENEKYHIPDLFKNQKIYRFELNGFAMNNDDARKLTNEIRVEPLLVHVIESYTTMDKEKALGKYQKYKIVEVPNDVAWHIDSWEMGGEYVAENHRIWQ